MKKLLLRLAHWFIAKYETQEVSLPFTISKPNWRARAIKAFNTPVDTPLVTPEMQIWIDAGRKARSNPVATGPISPEIVYMRSHQFPTKARFRTYKSYKINNEEI
jgi:hypothetical protein